MYLTRMKLDTSKRKTIMALASPSIFHGAVESAFPEKGGKLWRLDSLNGNRYLLIVSETRPDLLNATIQFGTDGNWETIEYDRFLDNICTGESRSFRLKANPVIAKSTGTGNRGKVLAHVTVDQQAKWLIDRAEKYGFSLNPEEFTVVQTSWESFQKGTIERKKVTFRTATFEGKLTVIDADVFKQTLKFGVGREKAYGCGLLTVSRRKS